MTKTSKILFHLSFIIHYISNIKYKIIKIVFYPHVNTFIYHVKTILIRNKIKVEYEDCLNNRTCVSFLYLDFPLH